MNIGIIITDIRKKAGTERAVSNLSNLLAERGNSVSIISIDSESGQGAYNLLEGVSIIHLNIHLSSSSWFNKIDCYRRLFLRIKEVVIQKKISCLIGTYSSINFLLPAFKRNIKVVGCEHFNYASAGLFHKILRFFIYRRLDAVVVLTAQDATHYSFIDKRKLFVIPNSLSFARVDNHNYDNKRILSIGRLTKQKGYDILIEVAERIVTKIDGWKFTIVGNGELKDDLLKQIKKKKLESVIEILSPTDNIIDLYKASSIYLMTSRWEGLPMVLLEAQACGIPIVSFDCPEGPASVIHDNEDGFLIKFMDVEMMVEKLLILMENKDLRAQFGKHAYESSLNYTGDSVYELWNNLFQQLEND